MEKPLENEFDEFWIAYPRKTEKVHARKMYEKARRDVSADVILRAAQKYRQERVGQPDCYTKHPGTWLNKGCYMDYQYEPKDKPTVTSGHFAEFCSPEFEAWEAFYRQQGKTAPRGKSGGWMFPTRWPPKMETAA